MIQSKYHPALHRIALLTACATFLLILMGGRVTSRQAGLAVPTQVELSSWLEKIGANDEVWLAGFLSGFYGEAWRGGHETGITHAVLAGLGLGGAFLWLMVLYSLAEPFGEVSPLARNTAAVLTLCVTGWAIAQAWDRGLRWWTWIAAILAPAMGLAILAGMWR